MTRGRGVSEKTDRITWRSRWMPHFWKFSRKSCWAFPSWNRTWRRGVGRSEEDPKPRGFQARVDLRLGAMCSLSERKRKWQNTITKEYKERKERVFMHEICMNMWRAKNNYIMGSTQSKPTSTQFSTFKNTSECMKHCENANGMQCMIIYYQINNT